MTVPDNGLPFFPRLKPDPALAVAAAPMGWLDEEYDPEAFRIDAVNLFLRKGRKRGG